MPYRMFTLLEPGPRKIIEAEKRHPKLLQFIEPIAKKIDDFIEQRLGIVLDRFETYVHPQEDYLLQSKKYPIVAVADGVTLAFKKDGTYPVPSPAGEVARICCENVIEEAEKRYEHFSANDMQAVFKIANRAVGEYNKTHRRTKETINFDDIDLFSATAAFGIFKGGTCYTASICDSSITHVDEKGAIQFQSPSCWPEAARARFPNDWKTIDEKERQKIAHERYRNAVNEKGELVGYGVVTGESAAERYVTYKALTVKKGDLIFFTTDGFTNYLKLPAFIHLFQQWRANLEREVKEFTAKKSREDAAVFGHERSLIAVFIGDL